MRFAYCAYALWGIGDTVTCSKAGKPMPVKLPEAITVAGIAAVAGVMSALLTAAYTHTSRNRELDIKLVEIGIGILRSDPKDTGLTAARSWAVQVIEDSSRVKFSEDDRRALLQKPLLYSDYPGSARVFAGDMIELTQKYLYELGFSAKEIEEILRRRSVPSK